jgi:hypothetical protein
MLSYADIEELLTVGSEDPLVLSLYLEMPRYLPGLRGVPDRVRDLLAAAADGVEGQVSGQAVAAAERDVRKVLEAGARYWLGHGAGMFLCGPVGLAERIVLPAGLGERAVFASRPHVRPLLTALQRWPVYQVAVVARRYAWLFTVAGEDVGVPALQAPAGQRSPDPDGWDWLGTRRAGERMGWFPRYRFRDAAGILVHSSDDEEPLVVAGYPDAIPEFLAALPTTARDRSVGSCIVDPLMVAPARVRELADPVVRHSVDRSEQELVARIRREPPGGRAAVGLAECLAVVNRNAVETLAVPGNGTVPGYACRQCGALATAGAGCACGRPAARAVPDLIEEMAVATIRTGGHVRTVGNPPGGIAACLRSPAAGLTRSAA